MLLGQQNRCTTSGSHDFTLVQAQPGTAPGRSAADYGTSIHRRRQRCQQWWKKRSESKVLKARLFAGIEL